MIKGGGYLGANNWKEIVWLCVHFTLKRTSSGMCRVGQNRMYTPYMTVHFVIFQPNIPDTHHICLFGSGQPQACVPMVKRTVHECPYLSQQQHRFGSAFTSHSTHTSSSMWIWGVAHSAWVPLPLAAARSLWLCVHFPLNAHELKHVDLWSSAQCMSALTSRSSQVTLSLCLLSTQRTRAQACGFVV